MADQVQIPANIVTLTVDGRAHRGWTGVRIRRSLDALTGSFELKLTSREVTQGEVRKIRALAPCTISIDGEQLITGTIDSLSISLSSTAHEIAVVGRDKAADLVDCSAIVSPGSWRKAKLETIVADLVKPFGIKVKFTADTGMPVRRFAIQQGETVHAAIERLCRFRALTAWSEPDGAIVIGNPASGANVGKIVEGESLIEMAISHDVADRYSDYIFKGQASGDDEANGKAVTQLKASAKDPAIGRYRPLLIVAEEQADSTSLKKRADWEANVRAARGQTMTATVPGWRDPSGAIWKPGVKVQAVAPSLDVDLPMLVISAELSRDEGGTVTRLELQRPEAWQQLAVPESADASTLKRAA